jgi:hypothetical protein
MDMNKVHIKLITIMSIISIMVIMGIITDIITTAVSPRLL